MSRSFEKDLLADKRVLITGGGTGLGKAIGRRYLELGADLVICGRRIDVLQATAQEFEQAFGRPVQTEQCDIRSSDAVLDRRVTPKTLYACSSRSSARYDPS